MTHEGNKHWLRKWIRFEPHQIIGGLDRPYLKRWYVLPRNKVVNVYLHQFLRSDDDRALHDHPWWFASLILKGSYWEHRADRPITNRSFRRPGSVAIRSAETAHRVELEVADVKVTRTGLLWNAVVTEQPVWTLIVTGPRVRRWGFHCPEGWKFWKDFVHDNGCGEA